MLKCKLEIMRSDSASKDRDRWCSSNVIQQVVPYCRCGTTKGAWSNFRMGWTRFELPVVDWRSSWRTSKNLARDTGSQIRWFTELHQFVRQSGDLVVYVSLDRRPMKLMQSLGDAHVPPLARDKSECSLQTLKPRNALNPRFTRGSVGVIETTADDRTGNVLGTV